MRERSQDSLKKARDVALLLLARRRHTREEVRCKLAARGFSLHIVEEVLTECERLHYIDDETAAGFYLEELVRKQLGLFRIRKSMISRGFEEHLINRLIIAHRFLELEPGIAAAAAAKKMSMLQRETDHLRRKDKLFKFLRSRGFSPSTISGVLAEIEDR